MRIKKSLFLLVLLVLCSSVTLAGWFSPDAPPPTVYNLTNLSATGTCPIGFAVQNLTHAGPECVFMGAGGGGIFGGIFNYTNIHGSDLTGISGNVFRTYLIPNLNIVTVDDFVLHPVVDYNFAGGLLSFNNPIWDSQDITLYYASNPAVTNFTYYNFDGINSTGIDGAIGRVLVVGNDSNMVAVDNYMLHPEIDFQSVGGNITFINPLWDDQNITVWVRI